MKEKTKRPLDISDLLIETCFALFSTVEIQLAWFGGQRWHSDEE